MRNLIGAMKPPFKIRLVWSNITSRKNDSFPMKYFTFLPLAFLFGLANAADEPLSYSRDVQPILAGHCYACHGPDDGDRAADLRLDTAEGMKTVLSAENTGQEFNFAPIYRVELSVKAGLQPAYARVAGTETIPYARHLEDAVLPSVEGVLAAVRGVMA